MGCEHLRLCLLCPAFLRPGPDLVTGSEAITCILVGGSSASSSLTAIKQVSTGDQLAARNVEPPRLLWGDVGVCERLIECVCGCVGVFVCL